MITNPSLDDWDIGSPYAVEWMSSGTDGAAAGEFHVMLLHAVAGGSGSAHLQSNPDFLYLLAGTLRRHGQEMSDGDAHAAAIGSTNSHVAAEIAATHMSIFELSAPGGARARQGHGDGSVDALDRSRRHRALFG